MSTILASISSNVLKKSIPLYASISIKINPPQFHTIPNQKLAMPSIRVMAHDPTYVPGSSPPEVPTAPPAHNPGIPPEMPRRHNVPEFDPIPPENPTPPPGPGPELPGPPPVEPEVVPPGGPEITPPEPGPPHPTPHDIPPPIMGSNGLVFY